MADWLDDLFAEDYTPDMGPEQEESAVPEDYSAPRSGYAPQEEPPRDTSVEPQAQYAAPEEEAWLNDLFPEESFDTFRQEPVQGPGDRGDFFTGVTAGIDNVQAMAGGATALVGAVMDDLGAETLGRYLSNYGMEVYGRNTEEAAKFQPKQSLKDLWENPSVGGVMDWAQYQAGALAPTMVEAVIGSGIGALAGTAATPGPGTAVGAVGAGSAVLFGKAAARKGLRKLLESYAKKRLAGDVLAEGMDVAVKKAAKTLGARAGVVLTTAQMEAGGMFGEDFEKRGKGVANPYSAASLGLVAGAVELMGGNIKIIDDLYGSSVAKKVGRALEKGHLPYVSRWFKKALSNVPEEMMQESAQELLSIANQFANWDDREWTEDDTWSILESAAAGAIPGVGGATIMAAMPTKQSRSKMDEMTGLLAHPDTPKDVRTTLAGTVYDAITEMSGKDKADEWMRSVQPMLVNNTPIFLSSGSEIVPEDTAEEADAGFVADESGADFATVAEEFPQAEFDEEGFANIEELNEQGQSEFDLASETDIDGVDHGEFVQPEGAEIAPGEEVAPVGTYEAEAEAAAAEDVAGGPKYSLASGIDIDPAEVEIMTGRDTVDAMPEGPEKTTANAGWGVSSVGHIDSGASEKVVAATDKLAETVREGKEAKLTEEDKIGFTEHVGPAIAEWSKARPGIKLNFDGLSQASGTATMTIHGGFLSGVTMEVPVDGNLQNISVESIDSQFGEMVESYKDDIQGAILDRVTARNITRISAGLGKEEVKREKKDDITRAGEKPTGAVQPAEGGKPGKPSEGKDVEVAAADGKDADIGEPGRPVKAEGKAPAEKYSATAGPVRAGRLTKKDIQATFKGATVEDAEGGYTVTLPNGVPIFVSKVDQILINVAAAKAAGYSDKQIAAAAKEGGASATWAYDGQHVLQLAKKATGFDLSHESFHSAVELALTSSELYDFFKKYGREEDAANAYADWSGKRAEANSPFTKIKDFFSGIADAFGYGDEVAAGFRKIEAGKVWKRTERTTAAMKAREAESKYSLARQEDVESEDYTTEAWQDRFAEFGPGALPVGAIGTKIHYSLDGQKWEANTAIDVFGTVNNRLGNELQMFERLFGESDKAMMAPGVLVGGKRPDARTIKAYDMGQEVDRVIASGEYAAIMDPAKTIDQIADERGFKGSERSRLIDDLKALRGTGDILGKNSKAGMGVDLILGTCQPTENCQVCYAASAFFRMSHVRKSMRNTFHIKTDPKGFAALVVKEAMKVPINKMPFLRLQGSGDLTSIEQVESYNEMSRLLDRPIQIFSRHHDNLKKLKSTRNAPFIKMGSVDSMLVKEYGIKALSNNMKDHGIANAILFTDESEVANLEKLNKKGAVGLILSASPKLHESLPPVLQRLSCPCDASERTHHGSCRQCVLSQAGCFTTFADKAIDEEGNIMSMGEPGSENAYPIVNLANHKDFDFDASYLQVFNFILDSSATMIKGNIRGFNKGLKKGIVLKDLRWPDDSIMLIEVGNPQEVDIKRTKHQVVETPDPVLDANLYIQELKDKKSRAKDGTFYLPGGEIQPAQAWESWRKLAAPETLAEAVVKEKYSLGTKEGDFLEEAKGFESEDAFIEKKYASQQRDRSRFKQRIAKDLGGKYTRKVEVPDDIASYIGDYGHKISTEDGDIYFIASSENGTIYMPNLAVVGKGKGLGTKFMNAMKKVADETSQEVSIYKVTNPKFFDRFDWLDKDQYDDFKYTPAEKNFIGVSDLRDIWRTAHGKETGERYSLGMRPVDTESKAFKDWFGESKVTDAGGKPLVVYHGTGSDFDAFDLRQTGKVYSQGEHAFFFTSEKKTAENYAIIAGGKKGKVLPVYLSIKNPIIIQAQDKYAAIEHYDDNLSGDVFGMQADGYDGVIINYPRGSFAVTFSPTQIKSAISNIGAFSPTDPRIQYSLGQDEDSEAFKRWSKGYDILSGDEISSASPQEGAVFRVYHGTTHDFDVFDPAVKGTKEGQFGAVNYFTSDRGDADQNYAGKGPDLTARVENEKDRISQELYEEYDFEGDYDDEIARVNEDYNIDLEAGTVWDAQSIANKIVENNLVGGTPQRIDAFVRLDNPAYIGGQTQTYIQNLDYEQFREDATTEILEENDAAVDDVDEYSDEIYDRMHEMGMYEEPAINNAIIEAVRDFETGVDPYRVIEKLELYDDEVTATDLEKALRSNDELADAYDYDAVTEGNIQSHLIGQVFKNLGFDGIVLQSADKRFPGMHMGGETSHVHVFAETPAQIKATTSEFTEDPRFKYSLSRANAVHNGAAKRQEAIWHSELESTIQTKLKDKAQSPEEWRKQIVALGDYEKVRRVAVRGPDNRPTGETTVKVTPVKGDFRQSELKWSGLIPWLYDQEGDISKQQVMDYLDSASPKVGEVVLTSPKLTAYGAAGELGRMFDTVEDDLRSDGEASITDDLGQELTFTADLEAEAFEVEGRYLDSEGVSQVETHTYGDFAALASDILTNGDFDWFGFPIAKHETYTLPGGEDYTELAITLDAEDMGFVNKQHFPFKNVIAHMRFSTRMDQAGGRTMHVEEVQSDWHKDMRKKGVSAGVTALPEGYTVVPGPSVNKQWPTFLVKDPEGKLVFPIEKYSREGAIEEAVRVMNKGVVAAPFAKEWPTVVMKRAIRWAVDNGFDSVSWTTGAQQTDRFSRDLRGAIDRVTWDFDGSSYAVTSWRGAEEVVHDAAFTPDGMEVETSPSVTPKHLSEYYGKEVAGKILNGPDMGEVAGDDLTIGGEDFKRFYDQDLVKRVNKIVKQFGAKVEAGTVTTDGYEVGDEPHIEVPITAAQAHAMWAEDRAILGTIDGDFRDILEESEIDRATGLVEARARYVDKAAQAHQLQINDAMRDSVPEGAQLWNRGRYSLGAVDTESATFKSWFGESVVTTDRGEPKRMYHGTLETIDEFKPGYDVRGNRLMFFTPSPRAAEDFIKEGWDDDAAGSILSVYLRIERPFVVDDQTSSFVRKNWDAIDKEFERYADEWGLSRDELATDVDDYLSLLAGESWQAFEASPSMVEYAKSRFDGVKLFEDGPSYAVFDPTQIKSAISNTGAFSSTDARISYSLGASERWVSQLQTAVDGLKQNKGSGDQMLAMIKKAGVPTHAIEWTGIDEFLAGKKSVTKAEIQAYVRQNDVHLEETMLGEDFSDVGAWWNDEGGANEETPYSALTPSERRQAKRQYQDEVGDYAETATKFAEYQLPGGTDYKELLITMPKQYPARDEFEKYNRILRDKYGLPGDQVSIIDIGRVATEAENEKWFRLRREAKVYREQVDYQSSHFDQPNILAHVRMNERVGADGEKILFVEEIQSDWAQAGRKRGYRGELPRGWEIVQENVESLTEDDKAELWISVEREGGRDDIEVGTEVDRRIAAGDLKKWVVKNERGRAVSREFDRDKAIEFSMQLPSTQNLMAAAIPDAPFKKNWQMLAMKRMISYGVENGFDRIAWTTGEQQAERYDLSKQVSEIQFSKSRVRDGYILRATGLSGEEIIDESNVPEDKLEDYVGKDLAQKIVDMQAGTLAAEDLKVGGEGMTGFYDKILPRETNKLLRKLRSGSEVGTTEIGYPKYDVIIDDDELYGTYSTKEKADAAYNNLLNFGDIKNPDRLEVVERGRTTMVHSFPLTTELRDVAMAGMPLYSLGKPGENKKLQHTAKMGELIERLKDNQSDILEKQRAVARYIQQSLPITERGRRELISQITRMAVPKTIKTREKYFQAALEMIDQRHEQVAKRDATDKLVRLLKNNRPVTKPSSKGKKLTADTYAVLNRIENVLTLDPDVAAEELDGLLAKIETLRHQENATDDKDRQNFLDMKERIFLLNRFADLKSRNSRDIVGAYEDLQAVIDTSRFVWQAEEDARKARMVDLREEATEDITGEEDITDREIRRRSVARKVSEKTTAGKIRAGMKGFDDKHQSFEWFLDKMSRYGEGTVLGGKMTAHFRELTHDATAEFDEGLYSQTTKMTEASERIFKLKGRALRKKLEHNSHQVVKSGVKQYFEDGTTENLTMSQNEAYKLWQWLQDPSLTKSMDGHGYTAETLKDLENFIDGDVMDWAKWQLYEFYPGYYDSINAVYREMYHVDLPYNPMYTPMVREKHDVPSDDILLDANTPYASVQNGSLKNRVENNIPPRLVDGDGLISQHVTQMEHFKAWAEPIREMRSVLGSSRVQGAIEAFHGTTAKSVLQRFIDDFARGGVDRAMVLHGIDKMRANFVKAVIGMNPVVFMKQLTSIPAYLTDMPVYHFTKGVADFALNPVAKGRILMSSKKMQARYRKGWERDIAAAKKRAAAAGIADVNSLTDAMMFPTKLGDKWAIMVGGWAQYKWKYDTFRRQGMAKEKAHAKALKEFEMATERSQQASDVKDQGQVQREGSLGKLFTMFMTSPQAYYRHISGGYRNLFAGRGDKAENLKRIAVAQFILPMMFQFVASGFEWDDDDQLRAFLMGPLNGLFLARDFAEPVVNALTGGQMWGSDGGVPLLSAATAIGMAASEAVKIVNGDAGEMSKLIDKSISGISKFAGIPYDPVKRLGGGIAAAATGTTPHPVRRAMGFSKYALDRKDKEETGRGRKRRSRPKRESRPKRSRPE